MTTAFGDFSGLLSGQFQELKTVKHAELVPYDSGRIHSCNWLQTNDIARSQCPVNHRRHPALAELYADSIEAIAVLPAHLHRLAESIARVPSAIRQVGRIRSAWHLRGDAECQWLGWIAHTDLNVRIGN